jgi:hypothetical protein
LLSHPLGKDGWTVGAGFSRPTAGGAANPACAPVNGAEGSWPVAHNRWRRQLPPPEPRSAPPHQLPRRGRGRNPPQLPSRAPACGVASQIPVVLHGCCYNYSEEGHIAANCTQPTKCVRCGGSDHISQPRTPSDDAPPDRRAPAVHRDVAGDAGGRESGEVPSPRSANDGGRTWHDVVSRQSTGTSTAFTVPFVRTGHGVGNDRTTDEPPTATYVLDVCYLSPSPEMV